MDLLNATTSLVKTIKKLALWNESSADSQGYEVLNRALLSGNQDKVDQLLNDMLSNATCDYDILNKALDYGYVGIANFMLDRGCEVKKISFVPSFTPLHNAVKLRDIELVKKLLEKSASVSAINSNKDSPLHLAYQAAFASQDYQLVDLLLDHIEETSSYINVKNEHGLSHLHIACARGNAQVVKKFLAAGASPLDSIHDDSPMHAGYSALEFACDMKSLDVIKICRQALPNKLQISRFLSENLSKKSYNAMNEILELLENPYRLIIEFREKFGETHDQLSDFHSACLRSDADAVESFLDEGEDVNAAMSRHAEYTPLYTALHFALESEKERYEKVILLLDRDADVYKRNGFCMTALHQAMYTHDWERESLEGLRESTLELLYSSVEDKEANPMDFNGLTYFHIAVVLDDVDLVKRFLDAGEDANQSLLDNLISFSDYTPLHFAAKYNCEEVAELLIDHGAEVNPKTHETPLQIALELGYRGLIELLLERNADVKVVKSNSKMTTLHLLVEYFIEKDCSEESLEEKEELIGFVEKLVSLGVDVNAKDSDGFTALHNACWNICNGIWLVERLLSVGADVNLKNNQGETPLDVVRRSATRGTYDDFLLLYHHVQRLKALGLEVDANNEQFCKMLMERKDEWKDNEDWRIVEDMYSDEAFARKERERFDEIAKLKGDMIDEGVSMYDYLRMDAERAAAYVENKKIQKIVEGEAEVFYEVYGYLVPVQYRKSLDWLAERASQEGGSK